MNNLTSRLCTSLIFAGATALLLTVPDVTHAQEEEESSSRYSLDEITVTARRQEEGLQDAPIAVTAISGLELENRGAIDIVDFADIAPNVSLKTDGAVSGFAAAPRTSIRGIGQADFVINTDPAVGMYVDGVYLGRSIGSVLDLVDVDRVEALRGPQGTLFGRNSTGGAINIISKKPEVGGVASGNIAASLGEGGYSLIRASANFPLGDTAAIRLSALKRERDGFIPVIAYDNLHLGAEDVQGLKAAFRWQPSDTFTLDVDADLSERSDSAAPIIGVDFGDLSVGETGLNPLGTRTPGTSTALMARRFNGEVLDHPAPISPLVVPFQSVDAGDGTGTGTDNCGNAAFRDSSPTCLGDYYASSRKGSWHAWFDNDGNMVRADDQSLETYGYSVRLGWDLDNISIKTISSWRGFDSSFTNGSPAPIYVATNNNVLFDQDQSSHEINLSGDFNDRFSWLAGIFYQEEEGQEIVQVRYPLAPPGNASTALPVINFEDRNIDNESQAIYAQLSAQVTDSLSLTLGARQTDETKSVYIEKTEFRAFGELVSPLEGVREADETSFLVNLSWGFSDDSMAYIQFSDGFRNGGFPARQPAGFNDPFENLFYDEEFVESWEIGLKSTALDGALRANIALFSTDFTDMQLNATYFDVSAQLNRTTIRNVGDATISGLEVEGSYLANDNLRFDVSLGYLNTELSRINEDGGQIILNAGSNLAKTITADSNAELPHAPALQANIGANYSFFMGNNAEIRNRIDIFYEDDQYSSVANYNQGLIPSTTRLNYTGTYIPQDGNWDVTLGIRNLTDEEDILNVKIENNPRAGLYHVLGRGREAYMLFKYSFGE